MEPGLKRLKLRYPGACRECGAQLAQGASALYDTAVKQVICAPCAADGTPAQLNVGSAGASAQREYERRVAKREQRIREQHTKLGGVILAMTTEPPSTTAWRTGANSEARLGRSLDELTDHGVRLLHDRRIPGSRANIDHIAISSAGVFVLDAKRYVSNRPHLRTEGGFLRSYTETLMIGTRKCNPLVDGMLKQLGRVKESLGEGDAQVLVTGMLVFIDADWPIFGGDFTTRGVKVLWPKKAAEHIVTPGVLSERHIEALHRNLAIAFPDA